MTSYKIHILEAPIGLQGGSKLKNLAAYLLKNVILLGGFKRSKNHYCTPLFNNNQFSLNLDST